MEVPQNIGNFFVCLKILGIAVVFHVEITALLPTKFKMQPSVWKCKTASRPLTYQPLSAK